MRLTVLAALLCFLCACGEKEQPAPMPMGEDASKKTTESTPDTDSDAGPNYENPRWVLTSLNMRTTPSINGAKMITLPAGTRVGLVSEKPNPLRIGRWWGKWTQVQFADRRGWVFGAYLSKHPNPGTCTSGLDYVRQYLDPQGSATKSGGKEKQVLAGGGEFTRSSDRILLRAAGLEMYTAFLLARDCFLRHVNEKYHAGFDSGFTTQYFKNEVNVRMKRCSSGKTPGCLSGQAADFDIRAGALTEIELRLGSK